MVFTLQCHGDPSVGIPGQEATVDVWVPENDQEHLQFVKDQLVECFRAIWDEKVWIWTEEQLKDDPEEARDNG
jgi:hypothetical protein